MADLAKKTNPDAVKEIDALTADLRKQAADKQTVKMRTRKPWQGWTGQGQAGLTATTGTTDDERPPPSEGAFRASNRQALLKRCLSSSS